MKGFELNPEISDDYQPKADNAHAIDDSRDKIAFRYVLAYQFLSPMIAAIANFLFITYFRMKQSTIDKFNQDERNRRGWEIRRNKSIIISMSLYTLLYVLCLDIAAMIYKKKIENAFKDWYLKKIFAISPTSYLIVDILGLLGFIFTLVLRCCIPQCRRSEILVWYLICFPVFVVTGHVDQIIIGFTHNVYHASAVFILYGIILIATATFLKIVSEVVYHKCIDHSNSIWQEYLLSIFTYFVLPLVGFLFFGLVIAMLLLLPINIPLDDASNKLVTFYRGTIIVFTAYFTYWLFLKSPQSPLDPLVKATDNRLKKKVVDQWDENDKKWARKTNMEKMEEISEKLLKIMDQKLESANSLELSTENPSAALLGPSEHAEVKQLKTKMDQ